MTDYTRPLILIAAAIFWNGAAIFFTGRGSDSNTIGIVGICLTALLVLIALFFPRLRRFLD